MPLSGGAFFSWTIKSIRTQMQTTQTVKALIQAGQWESAKTACTALCARNPNDAEAWFLLGVITAQLGMLDEAENCCRKTIALRPDVPAAHFNLGIALQRQGKLDEALACFHKAIALNPNYPEAFNELGVTLQLKGVDNLGMAINNYKKALALRPDYPEGHYNLATAWLSLTQYEDALTHFQQALRCQPDSIKYLVELGNALVETGMLQEATESFQRALELNPADTGGRLGMARVAERKGEFDASMTLLQPLLGGESINVGAARLHAALSRKVNQQPQAVNILRSLLEYIDTPRDRREVHYALGKLYDEMKDYPSAFEHYRQANLLEEWHFDQKTSVQQFDATISMFNAEKIERRPRASNKSSLPVFIVGMPRSGTSLVEQILSSHPEVVGAGELRDVGNMKEVLPDILGTVLPYPYNVDLLKPRQLDQLADRHLAKLSQLADRASRVTDKMPHNFLHLGLIDMLFPGARIIHCKRAPLDTCLSIHFLPFNHFHAYATDLGNLGMYYRQYERLMDHWKKVVRIPMLDVQYEELVENQEEMSRRMVDFCGLNWDERCLRFYESDRVVTTFSYDQVRRPMYKKSVARWKNYAPHLGALAEALGINLEP